MERTVMRKRIKDTKKYKGRKATIVATPEIEKKLNDLQLALPLTMSGKTKQEYRRVAIQLLSASRENPLQVKSKGKWTQCKTVVNWLKRKRDDETSIVPKEYVFWGLPDTWNVHEDTQNEILHEKHLDREQFRNFLSRLSEDERGQQLRRACRFAFYCGLRRSEVLALQEEYFKQENGMWVIMLPKRVAKGKKARKVPVPADQIDLIEEFTSFTITANYIVYELHKVAKTLGKERKWTFHSLRHSFATNFVKAGGDVRALQKILGHDRIETTTIYEHADINTASTRKLYGYE
jgi:integrase/recombinase XerD